VSVFFGPSIRLRIECVLLKICPLCCTVSSLQFAFSSDHSQGVQEVCTRGPEDFFDSLIFYFSVFPLISPVSRLRMICRCVYSRSKGSVFFSLVGPWS
jgi:hypothetical protein